MEDIRGPAPVRTTWDKLGNNVNEEVLATYLKNEYPQTIALWCFRRSSQSMRARVLALTCSLKNYQIGHVIAPHASRMEAGERRKCSTASRKRCASNS